MKRLATLTLIFAGALAIAAPAAVTAGERPDASAMVCVDGDTGMMRDCADWYTHREGLDDGTIVRQSCKLVREYTRSDSISILWGLITISYGESEEWCDYGDCGDMSAVDSHLR